MVNYSLSVGNAEIYRKGSPVVVLRARATARSGRSGRSAASIVAATIRAFLHGHTIVEELDAALLLQLSVAPSLGVAEDEANTLDALRSDLCRRLLSTRAHAEREEAEVG